jgi:hypothetical protein
MTSLLEDPSYRRLARDRTELTEGKMGNEKKLQKSPTIYHSDSHYKETGNVLQYKLQLPVQV